MSSEMRELIAKWRHSANEPADGSLKTDYDFALEDCANDLESLLARTEAGADGAVAEVTQSFDGSKKIGSIYWDRLEVGDKLYLHPQDASVDAERTKALLLALIQIRDSTYRNATQLRGMANDALERDRTRPVTAMQAKEAK